MAEWQRYPKIVGSTASWAGPVAGDYIVTEKAHGANFSVTCNSHLSVEFASRSGILAPCDDFFGFRSQGLHACLSARVRALHESLLHDGVIAEEQSIVVYGELCGGLYPHEEVQAVRGAKPVQRGCWYSPQLCFFGFDVGVLQLGSSGTIFLDFAIARQAALAAGFMFVAPLLQGSMSDCLAFDYRFSSTIPAMLKLPSLEEDPNWAEGIVIRPAREPTHGGRRMLKLKIEEFSEKQYSNDRWRESRSGGSTSGLGGGDASWYEREELLRYEMQAAVNENRLQSALSKLGRIDPADRVACRRLFEAVCADVEESLRDDGLLTTASELAESYASVRHALVRLARQLVTGHLRRASAQHRR